MILDMSLRLHEWISWRHESSARTRNYEKEGTKYGFCSMIVSQCAIMCTVKGFTFLSLLSKHAQRQCHRHDGLLRWHQDNDHLLDDGDDNNDKRKELDGKGSAISSSYWSHVWCFHWFWVQMLVHTTACRSFFTSQAWNFCSLILLLRTFFLSLSSHVLASDKARVWKR